MKVSDKQRLFLVEINLSKLINGLMELWETEFQKGAAELKITARVNFNYILSKIYNIHK